MDLVTIQCDLGFGKGISAIGWIMGAWEKGDDKSAGGETHGNGCEDSHGTDNGDSTLLGENPKT